MNEGTAPKRPAETWASGGAYELYVGRWSRLVAGEFLQWLALPAGSRWLDLGCGTGALSQSILQFAAPARIQGLDRSEGYIAHTRAQIQDSRAFFTVGDAQALPFATGSFDAAVSGLMLNFIPQPGVAASEMRRVVRPGGVAGAYVWDYVGKMEFMRYFWNAAVSLDPKAADLDEGRRFPLCQPEPLMELFKNASFKDVRVQAIDISTEFKDFEDYWVPFLGGQGPAPGYTLSLSKERRAALRDRIRAGLPFALDGSIPLSARAWAVKGVG